MCSQPEWTPPSETRPSRCRRPRGLLRARSQAAEQRLVLEEAAVGDRVVDPGQVLLDDRAGAEVEVADLGVAHLPVGQADVAALGGELGVRVARPRGGRRPASRRARSRCRAPARPSPQPSRMTSASGGDRAGSASAGRLDDRREVVRVEAGAADQRAVDVGLRQQLGGVVRASPSRRRGSAPRRRRRRARASTSRMKAIASWACSGVAVRPVPIAQIGS